MGSSLFYGKPTTVLASAARTTSSNSGNLKNTTGDFHISGALAFYLDVTAHVGDASGTTGFDVYLDHSPDGGTTWLNFAKFAAVTTSTATRVINMRPTGIGAVEAASEAAVFSSTSSVAVATNVPLTEDRRVRWELGNNTGATTAYSATFAVFCIEQPMGGGVS